MNANLPFGPLAIASTRSTSTATRHTQEKGGCQGVRVDSPEGGRRHHTERETAVAPIQHLAFEQMRVQSLEHAVEAAHDAAVEPSWPEKRLPGSQYQMACRSLPS